ncbi:pumilio homolog 12-like [Prosopis cineraria]|uniref:pumilio homolog 12-like n=1 Tax=Prosopis cineraria TaxID=364024 RepID=UPI00240EC89D|nr:pumilio homolog 12-like [Prosopis cineraria]
MEEYNQFLQNGSLSHFPTNELPENHHLNDDSVLTSQHAENQNSRNNIGDDENNNPISLHQLEAQLQSLRIDSTLEGLHGNSTNQQTLVGNSRIRPSQVNHEVPYGHNNNIIIINHQNLARNSGIVGPSHLHEGQLQGNNRSQQVQVQNFGIGPSHDGNSMSQQTLARNFGIGTWHGYDSSTLGRMLMRQQRYNTITSLEAMRGRVVSMSKDEDGSDFLVRLLDRENPGDIEFISREVIDHLHDLMMDQFGSRVIQKIFDVLTVDQTTSFFESITINLLKFQIVCTNCIGNYVVQYVIKMRMPGLDENIVNQLRGQYVDLSMDKHASNVVEHLLQFSTDNNVAIIVHEIMASPRFLYLLRDSYGNYVAQRSLECSKGPLYHILVNRILQHYRNLCTDQYGKKVLEFMYGRRRFHPKI